MLALNVFAAETEAEARRLRTSMQLAFARLRSGQPGRLPAPVERIEDHVGPDLMALVDHALACTAVGTAEQVAETIRQFLARYAPEEVILTGQIHDHAARLRSFEIAAGVMRALDPAPAAADQGRPATIL
jgi:alkanesulfonate monooxygenase SsuD/methylene tetrahydromethanopterin reductase-like flavin-dependent oxidoreductase (luciferase family)